MVNLNIVPLGPYVLDEHHQLNTFYVKTDHYHILFDLVPIQFYAVFTKELKKYIEVKDVNYLVLSNTHMSTLYVIDELIKDGFSGTIISNHFFSRQIENAYPFLEVQSLKALNYELKDESWGIFNFK